MKAKRFPDDIVAAIRDGKILRLRAGTQPHGSSASGPW